MARYSQDIKMIRRYGATWSPVATELQVEMECIRKGGRWIHRGVQCGAGLFHHVKRMQQIIHPDKEWHKWNDLLLKEFCDNRVTGVIGPASCVVGETGILEPFTGEEVPIEHYWREGIRPWVMTTGGPALGTVPVLKGVAPVFRVTLVNGRSFVGTAEHRVCTNGRFRAVSSIRPGQTLLAYEPSPQASSLELFQPEFHADGRHWSQRASGFRSGYPACPHSCDEQPLLVEGTDRYGLPSPNGASGCKAHAFFGSDDSGSIPGRIRLDQQSSHLSSCSGALWDGNRETVAMLRCALGTPSAESDWFQPSPQSLSMTHLLRPFSSQVPDDVDTPIQMDAFASSKYAVQHVAVASVEFVGERRFFDLHVPVFNHYFAEGTIHHNSGKTRESADFVRMMYYCNPHELTVLVSSTEREMLEKRIWGEIKANHRVAQDRFPSLPGILIESRQIIITDSRNEYSDGRDFRNGMCGVAVKRGGSYQGLGSLAGTKNKMLILVADELSFMPKAFIDAISNMNKNPWFKCIGIGNPKDETDALGILCEPTAEHGGWQGGIDQTGGTKTWNIRFPNSKCVQLVGPDSPNFDVPAGSPPPYPFLIKPSDIAADKAFYGADSHQYRMMDEGRMPRGVGNRRVITRTLCEKHHALEEPVWRDGNLFKIGFMDAAYSAIGGDRTVFGELRFGMAQDENGEWRQMLALIDTVVVPISGKVNESPEDQIAEWTKAACEERGILPQNFFFDGTGRSSLTSAFARLWSAQVNPIEFGGTPSNRLVSRQIKTECAKYYSKFVTELWWCVRLIIEAGQFRGMTTDVMAEGCMREWGFTTNGRIEVETKDKMKVRLARSPDLFDSLCFDGSTMILTPNGEVRISDLKAGDEVSTPYGATTIVRTISSESGDITDAVLPNGRHLIGTSDHDIFTWNNGWTALDALRVDDELEMCYNLNLWRLLNMCFTRPKNITFKHLASIIQGTTKRRKQKARRRDYFIESYGKSTLETFLKVIAFITRTAIGETTKSTILNSLKSASTHATTWLKGKISSKGSSRKLLPLEENTQNCGTHQRKESNGTEHMGKTCGSGKNVSALYASTAEQSSMLTSNEQDSALLAVARNTEGQASKIAKDAALCVAKSFWRTVTRERNIAHVTARPSRLPGKRRVYNLTLLEHNVYYANGVLVKNCAGVEGARRRGFVIDNLATVSGTQDSLWVRKLLERTRKVRKSYELSYS